MLEPTEDLGSSMPKPDRSDQLDELRELAVDTIQRERARLQTERAFLQSVLDKSFGGSATKADDEELAVLSVQVGELLGS